MKKFILNLGSTWLADLAIFIILGLTPLFFNYFFPTSIDLSKIVFFKVFVLLLLVAIVWRLAVLKIAIISGSWKKLIPLFSLFIFLIISLFFSVDITSSWFGSYDRQEGLVSWLFYGLWLILLVLHLSINAPENKLVKISNFFKVISFSGFLVSIYALAQLFGYDFVTWAEPASITGRAISSFGQPNYLACWLLLVLPVSAYLVFSAQKNTHRFGWLSIFLAEILALFATGSRAAFFVFLIFSVIWLVWFLMQKKLLSRQKLLLVTVIGVVLAFIFVGFLAISNQERFAEFADLKKGSAYVRLEIWQTGWQAFLKKPLLGYGLENQKEAYVSYYHVNDAIYSRPNTYTDRAHNLILDILLTNGIIGLIFFSYFIYWIFANLFKALKNKTYQNLAAFLIWSLTVYLLSILFNFSVTVTNIYFWLIVALSIVISNEDFVAIKTEQRKYELSQIVLVLSSIILFLYGASVEINRLKADYYYQKASLEISKSEYFTALVLKDYLDETNPNQSYANYYNQAIALRFLEQLPQIDNKSSLFVTLRYLTVTEKTLTPVNFENKFVKAFILGATSNRVASEKMFNDLAILSPELPKIYLAWGDVLMLNHDYKNAVLKFEKVLSLLPASNNKYLSKEQLIRLDTYKRYVQFRLDKVKLLLK